MRSIFSYFLHAASYLLPILSGIATGLLFVLPGSGGYIFLTLIPLFLFVLHPKVTPKRAFIGGLLFGVIALGASIFWFFDTAPLSWVGIESSFWSILLIMFVWGTSTITLSLGPALFGYAVARWKRETILDIISVPLFWIANEYVRALFFSLVWFAPGMPIGPYWTFGWIGPLLTDIPQLFRALSWLPIHHAATLSLIAVLPSTLIAWRVTQANIHAHERAVTIKDILFVFLIGVIIWVGYLFSPTFSNHEGGEVSALHVGVIHLDTPPDFGTSPEALDLRVSLISDILMPPFEHIAPPTVSSTTDTPSRALDLLVFPEDTRYLSSLSPEERAHILNNILSPEGIAIDSATYRSDDGALILIQSFYAQSGEIVAMYGKRFLIPFGEYLPSIITLPASIVAPTWKDSVLSRRGYGADPFYAFIPTANTKGMNIAALFCGEIIPFTIYDQAAQNGATIFVNTASHSVFHSSSGLSLFTFRQAKTHSIIHHTPFIHAGNGVASFLVDPSGKIANSTHNTGAELLIVSLPIHNLLTEETP